ncbi:MAG: cytochrome C [Bacteroidales bacterium]
MNLRIKHIVTTLLVALLFSFQAKSQISPGDLAKVHSHLEGMSNCTQCHILGEKVSNAKCLACHTELKARVDQNKGYHSSALVKGKQCASCHNDHHGVNFQILKFDKDKFDHNLAGYKLTGAHSKKKCADCHKAEFIADKKIKSKKFTYLGLKTECLTCHDDYHQKTLASTCADCHNDEKFKPASKFDHQKTKFKLTGKHEHITCAECHKTSIKNGVKFQEFKGVKATNCTNCHKDPHANKFGQNCSECHNNESFTVVGGVNNFDHSKADFKLEGKHLKVQCKSCHKLKLTTPLNFKNCTDCHTDYHEKQFAKNGVSPDCSTCHTVKGFTEFSYTIEQHNSGAFVLKGSHVATPCFACHKKLDKWKFKEIGKTCTDCHENVHENFIDPEFYPESNCEACHNLNRWKEVEFDHKKTKFELEGTHTKQTCRDCHFNKEKTGHAYQKFVGLANTCTNCHKDVHAQQFDNNGVTDCKRCHNSDSFKPVTKFDHNKTLFPLDGKHINVACVKCHKQVSNQGVTFVQYKIKEFKCENCHR